MTHHFIAAVNVRA